MAAARKPRGTGDMPETSDFLQLTLKDGGGRSLLEASLKVADPDTDLDRSKKTVAGLLELYLRLRNAADESRFLQAGVIVRIFQTDRWKAIAPNLSWPEFCEKKLGMKVRTAQQLIQLHNKAVSFGLDHARLAKIGWTKAREFMRVATKDNVEEWIRRAATMTAAEIREAIALEKANKASPGEEDVQSYRRFSVKIEKLSDDERNNIESGIEEAVRILQQRDGSAAMPSRGMGLDMIVTDWRSNAIAEKDRSLAWHLKHLERVYGVELKVIGEAAGEYSDDARQDAGPEVVDVDEPADDADDSAEVESAPGHA